MPSTLRKAAMRRRAAHHLAEGCRPVGLAQAIQLRQAEPYDGRLSYRSCAPRLLTRPTFLGGMATAFDFLDLLRDYDASLPSPQEQEAEIESYFADAFVHFGRAFSAAAAALDQRRARE